jgi:hypothetical protein
MVYWLFLEVSQIMIMLCVSKLSVALSNAAVLHSGRLQPYLQKLRGANALAYFAAESVTDKKVFVRLAPLI